MSDQRDRDRMNAAIEGAAAARGPCPDVERLLAFSAGSLSPKDHDTVQAHLDLCPSCSLLIECTEAEPEEMDEVTWKRSARNLDRRAAPWRSRPNRRAHIGAALAAGLVLAIGFAWWRAPEPPIDPGVRGAGFSAVSPSGSLTRVSGFAWMALPLAESYRLSLIAGETEVWEETTTGQSITAPPALLQPGQPYRWRVEALDADGRVIGQTDWTEFRIAPLGD